MSGCWMTDRGDPYDAPHGRARRHRAAVSRMPAAADHQMEER
jgi:hypothetical protein